MNTIKKYKEKLHEIYVNKYLWNSIFQVHILNATLFHDFLNFDTHIHSKTHKPFLHLSFLSSENVICQSIFI